MKFNQREVIAFWIASRVGVFLAAAYAAWVLTGSPERFIADPGELVPPIGPLDLWARWDFDWYRSIADSGYRAPGFENSIAFLPAFPLLLMALGEAGVPPIAAGLLISAVAGGFAALALNRLSVEQGGRPSLSVIAWAFAPMAVFLAAPYTESLFAAFAFWAWWCARQGRWALAAILCAGASLTRINGLFVVLALAVMLLTEQRQRWRKAAWLAVPLLALGAYAYYLVTLTGSWTAWMDAQRDGWGREFTAPWTALKTTWEMAFSNGVSASFAIQYQFEILFMLVLIVFTVFFLVRRQWPEFTWVALTAAALCTSTLFYSVPRSLLTVLPIWLALGMWMSKSRTVRLVYVAIAAPLMVIGVVAFTSGRWVA